MNLFASIGRKPKRNLAVSLTALVLCAVLIVLSVYWAGHPAGDFIPLEEVTEDGQLAQVEIQVLDTIASDSTQVFYFAAGPSSYLYLLTLPSSRVNGEFREMFNQSLSFDGSELLDPITVYGTAHEIPDELIELCLETFNLPDETEFRNYFGYYYLNSTELPTNWLMIGGICLSCVSGLCGLFFLTLFVLKRRFLQSASDSNLEEKKESNA